MDPTTRAAQTSKLVPPRAAATSAGQTSFESFAIGYVPGNNSSTLRPATLAK